MFYCPDFKRTLVSEALQTNNSVESVAKKHGIGRSTLFKWVKAHGADVFSIQKKRGRPKDWSFASKLKAVLETQNLGELELGEYLRHKGLYYSHIVLRPLCFII